MKLKYEMPLRTRVKSGKEKHEGRYIQFFMYVSVDNYSFIHPQCKWVKDEDLGDYEYEWCSTASNKCNSVRAFKRMIRKHKLPKGSTELVSRFVGCNVRW